MSNESRLQSTDEPTGTAGYVGRSLEFADRTLPRILQLQSRLGDKVMIQTRGRSMTYAEAPQVAARCAGQLIGEGVSPVDRVIVFLSNRIEYLELWFGLSWAGSTMVPVNTALRGEQLRHAICTARPTIIVTEASLLEHIGDVADSLDGVQAVCLVDQDQSATIESVAAVPVKTLGDYAAVPDAHPVKASDVAAILYTSGTTGPSKGVVCSHAQFYWWGVLTGESLDLSERDTLFTVLPFFHTNALNTLWQCILFGATYSFAPRFSASRFWKDATSNKATVTYLLGAMAQILLKKECSKDDQSHQVRVALCPATPLEMVREFTDRFGIKLIEGYGSTETNLVFSNVVGGHAPASMGRVVDGFEVRLVDLDDQDVEDGQAGELIVRNREPFSMASGYFENDAATVKAWRNLWFHTGDRVYRDPKTGVYFFLDRLVDAIRRRGENISSWEVENALDNHPDIEISAVFGVPSDLGSEEDVMTHVVARRGCSVDPVKVIQYLEKRLAYFAIPRYWEIVSSLPKTENGKVKKHMLRDRGIGPNTWDRESKSTAIRG